VKTVISSKGQVVIPKPVREKLGLKPGLQLEISVEGDRIILKPVKAPPNEIFVEAGPEVTEPILMEVKRSSDKVRELLKELRVE